MATTIKAVYEDGVFKPREPVSLEEHAEVEVTIPTAPVHVANDPGGWKAIQELIGLGKAVAPDVSERHDDHLYGQPHD